MTEEPEYDVVIDTLQKQSDVLLKMVQRNSEMGLFNIVDQIRLKQIQELENAIKERKNALQKQGQ